MLKVPRDENASGERIGIGNIRDADPRALHFESSSLVLSKFYGEPTLRAITGISQPSEILAKMAGMGTKSQTTAATNGQGEQAFLGSRYSLCYVRDGRPPLGGKVPKDVIGGSSHLFSSSRFPYRPC